MSQVKDNPKIEIIEEVTSPEIQKVINEIRSYKPDISDREILEVKKLLKKSHKKYERSKELLSSYGISDVNFVLEKVIFELQIEDIRTSNTLNDIIRSGKTPKYALYAFLQIFQEGKVTVDGVLGKNTLKAIIETYPDIFSEKPDIEDQIRKFLNVPGKTKVIKETQQQLSEQEKNLPLYNKESLAKISLTPNDAKVLALKEIPHTGIDLTKNDIKIYQKEHGLQVDGEIGAETYLEMKAKGVLERAKDRIKNEGISSSTAEDIIDIFEKHKSGKLNGVNISALYLTVKSYKNGKGYEDGRNKNKISNEKLFKALGLFEENIQKNGNNPLTNPKTQTQIDQALASQDGKNIVEKVKEANTTGEAIDVLLGSNTGRAILPFVAIGFVFGMFGTDSNFTNSWWKRILVLFGGGALYGAIKKDMGKGSIGEVFDAVTGGLVEKAGENISKVSKEMGKGFDAAKAKSANIFKDGFNLGTMWEGVKSFFSNSFDTVSLGINNYNESLKSVDNGKDYIETEKLNGLRDIFLSDEKFLNTRKADITEDYNNLLSQSAKDKLAELFPNNSQQKEKNIKSFINKHLLEHSMEDLGENDLVRSMFMTSEITQKLDETLTQNVEYSENSKLQEKIQGQLAVFLQDSSDYSENMKNAGRNIIKAIKNGTIENFDLNTYGVDKNKEAPRALEEIQKLVGYNKGFLETRKKIQAEIQDLEKFRYVANGNIPDTEKTIVDKYNNLVAAEKDFNGTYTDTALNIGKILNKNDFPVSEYETAVYAIKVELLEQLKEDTGVFGGDAGGVLMELNLVKAQIDTQNKINALPVLSKIGEVPKESDSEEVFEAYLTKNLSTFQKAKKLAQDNPKDTKVQEIVERFDDLVVELGEKLKARQNEINVINTTIIGLVPKKIVSKEEIQSRFDVLAIQEQKYLKLNREVRGQNGFSIDWIYNMVEVGNPQNLYISMSQQVTSVDSTVDIYGELFERNLYTLKDNFPKIRSDILDKLKIDVDFENQNINNGGEIQAKLGNIIALNNFIKTKEDSVSDILSEAMISKLNTEIKVLLVQYKKAISSSNSPEGVKKIKESYNTNVYEFLKGGNVLFQAWSAVFGDLESGKGEIDKAVRERVEELVLGEKEDFYETAFTEIGLYNFFKKYGAEFPDIYNTFRKNSNNITITQIQNTLMGIVGNTSYSEELIKDGNEVLEKINAQVKEWVKEYLN